MFRALKFAAAVFVLSSKCATADGVCDGKCSSGDGELLNRVQASSMLQSAQPTQIAAMSFSHTGQETAMDKEPAHFDAAGAVAFENLLIEAAEFEKGRNMTNTGTLQALTDIIADVDGKTDPTPDVAPGGKDHDAAEFAIQEVSANIAVEQSIEDGTMVTGDMLEAINGESGTPEDVDLTGTPDSMAGGMVVEGDMIAGNQTQLLLLQEASKKGWRWAGTLWPNGLIRFCFDSTADSRIKKGVRDAKAYIEKNTCIRMDEIGLASSGTRCSKSGVLVKSGNGCSSYVGVTSWLGGGQMALHSPGCTSLGIVVHEFLHALGQTHEQSRPDRAQYVQILWQNIEPGKGHNFRVEPKGDDAIPYDYSSLMHYGATDFGINRRTTIKANGHTIGNRQGMSNADKNQLSRMYSSLCPGEPSPTPPPPTPPTSPTTPSQPTATPAYDRVGTGLCNDPLGIRTLDGNGDNEGTNKQRLAGCAAACFGQTTVKKYGPWSSRGAALGFSMKSTGRCYCNHVSYSTCQKKYHSYEAYEFQGEPSPTPPPPTPPTSPTTPSQPTASSVDDWNGQTFSVLSGGFCYRIRVGGKITQSDGGQTRCSAGTSYVYNLGSYSSTSAGAQNYAGGSGTCFNGGGRASTLRISAATGVSGTVAESPTCFYTIHLLAPAPQGGGGAGGGGTEGAAARYTHYDRACVSGQNLESLYASGVTEDECAEICNANDNCLAFEYGMNYANDLPMRSGVSAGACRPQKGKTVNNGCGSWNLDLYVKPR